MHPPRDLDRTPTAPVVNVYIFNNGVTRHREIKCNQSSCSGVTFKRIQELKRHKKTLHSRHAARFWCPVKGCKRSKMGGGGGGGGGKPFPRKDKMADHFKRMHGDNMGSEGSSRL
jgi:hypothetical protein